MLQFSVFVERYYVCRDMNRIKNIKKEYQTVVQIFTQLELPNRIMWVYILSYDSCMTRLSYNTTFQTIRMNPTKKNPAARVRVFQRYVSTWATTFYFGSTNHLAPRCAISSIPPLPLHSSVQIFSSKPCSQTPSASIPPAMSATTFHTHFVQLEYVIIKILFIH